MTKILSILFASTLLLIGDALASTRQREAVARRLMQQADVLTEEIIRWKQSPLAAEAKLLGVYKEKAGSKFSTQSTTPTVSADELWRFALSKATTQELSQKHPAAAFSTNTPFVLLTTDEFKAFVGRSGLATQPRAPLTTTTNSSASVPTSTPANSMPHRRLADYFDWSQMGCVGPVKNQGGCGSCSYFAASGAVEAAICIYEGKGIISLSEQELVSCSLYGYGCGGAWPNLLLSWIKSEGACLEAQVPYTSGGTLVNGECSAIKCEKIHPPIQTVVDVDPNEDALIDAISTTPTTVTLAGGDPAFQYYAGGVLEGCDESSPMDHAVLAVGYGHDNGLYYKLKNSWGTWWGEGGYVKLRRGIPGKGACRITEWSPTYPAF